MKTSLCIDARGESLLFPIESKPAQADRPLIHTASTMVVVLLTVITFVTKNRRRFNHSRCYSLYYGKLSAQLEKLKSLYFMFVEYLLYFYYFYSSLCPVLGRMCRRLAARLLRKSR